MNMAGSFRLPPRTVPVVLFSGVVSALRWSLLLAILGLLVPYGLAYVENSRAYPATRYIYQQQERAVAFSRPLLQKYVPTRIGGRDRTDLILAAALAIVALVLGWLRGKVETRSTARQMRKQVMRWKADMQLQESSRAAVELESKFKSFESAKDIDRNELLRVFAEAKKKLDEWGREVAFLAIDVVGSSTMKENEDAAAIQYDFVQYRRLVERVLKANNVMKSAWTPDGTMACFATIDEAVLSGKQLIEALPEFNKAKLMRRGFSVRCGVNAGYVHFDPDTPLEYMSDRVIDIAGHMQKHAEPNTVAVARKVIEPLRDAKGFLPTDKIVDGYEVSHWQSEQQATQVV